MTFVCAKCGSKHKTMNGLAAHRRWCYEGRQSIQSNINRNIPLEDPPNLDFDELSDVSYDEVIEECHNDRPVNLTYVKKQEAMIREHVDITAAIKEAGVLSMLIKIFKFGEDTALSRTQGGILLKLLRSLFPVAMEPFPNIGYKTLVQKVELLFGNHYIMQTTSIKLPFCFSTSNTTVYEGKFVDIITVIGDMMLDRSVDDFHLEPLILEDSNGTQVCREPASATDFAKMYEYVTKEYGTDVVPLPLTIATDELALNKMGSRGAKPLYVQLSSRTSDEYWSSDNIRCIGFSPRTEVVFTLLHITKSAFCH